VLKNSKADLWVRNVQLSLFSLIPALLPILYSNAPPHSRGFFLDLFRNFGGWAWATVAIQVFGGLITAIVIKYSDNILKGFATSLSIIISSLASVILFDFRITPSFMIGSTTVLVATWMYNQPAGKEVLSITNVVSTNKPTTAFSPTSPSAPILGEFPKKKSSPFGSPRNIATVLGLAAEPAPQRPTGDGYFPETQPTQRYLNTPYGSPRPSPLPSRANSPRLPSS
jgi:solute carrier family 35 (UDP-sugar transporter), member A1/2/3